MRTVGTIGKRKLQETVSIINIWVKGKFEASVDFPKAKVTVITINGRKRTFGTMKEALESIEGLYKLAASNSIEYCKAEEEGREPHYKNAKEWHELKRWYARAENK